MRYWIYKDSQILGPLEKEELRYLQGSGSDSLVCPEDIKGSRETEWLSAEEVPELAGLWGAAPSLGAAEQGLLTEASAEGLPLDALSFEGIGGGEWVPPGFEGPVTPRTWDSLLEIAATHHDAIEKERTRASELEARLTGLAETLSRYEGEQNAILERLGAKERVIEEKDQELKRLQEELREVLARGVQPASVPAAVEPPAEPAPETPAKPPEPAPPASAAPPSRIELPVEIDLDVDAVHAPAPAPQTQAPSPAEAKAAQAPTAGGDARPPASTALPVVKLPAATRLTPVGHDLPPAKGFEAPRPPTGAGAPPAAATPLPAPVVVQPTPAPAIVPTPVPQTVTRGEPVLPGAPTPMPAWRNLGESSPTPTPTGTQTPVPSGLLQPPRTVIFATGAGTPEGRGGPAGSFQELLARTPIPATAAVKGPVELMGTPAPHSDPDAGQGRGGGPAFDPAPAAATDSVPDMGASGRTTRRRQWKGIVLMTVAVLAFAMVMGVFFMGRDPKEVISLFATQGKRRVIEPEEVIPPAQPRPPLSAIPRAPEAPAGPPSGSAPPPSAPPALPPSAQAADQAAQAVELAKNYPLGGGRKTVLEWLQYSHFPKGDEEEWSANPQGANVYFVQYRYFRGGPNVRGVEPIIYIFEADLARRSLRGINPAAKQLLGEGGPRPAAPAAKKPRAKAPPRARRKAPAREEVPLLPLPEDEEALPEGFNNPAEPEE